MTDLPIACTLTAGERTARGDALLTGLARLATAREPIDNGYRLVFASDASVTRRIADTIDAERHCCRFLRFDVAYEPNRGPITLSVTGPPGTREFLDDLLG